MCVRPSTGFYSRFSLGMGRSPGFGPACADSCALLRLAFAAAPRLCRLTSPAPAARRTVLQKVRGRTFDVLPQLVNTGFQVLFHSPPGVLFTFPSQYYALSVTKECLALGGGPPDFPQGSTCLAVLWILPAAYCFPIRGLHPLWQAFPGLSGSKSAHNAAVRNPGVHARRFGLPRFRSPLLPGSIFLSFPPAT